MKRKTEEEQSSNPKKQKAEAEEEKEDKKNKKSETESESSESEDEAKPAAVSKTEAEKKEDGQKNTKPAPSKEKSTWQAALKTENFSQAIQILLAEASKVKSGKLSWGSLIFILFVFRLHQTGAQNRRIHVPEETRKGYCRQTGERDKWQEDAQGVDKALQAEGEKTFL